MLRFVNIDFVLTHSIIISWVLVIVNSVCLVI